MSPGWRRGERGEVDAQDATMVRYEVSDAVCTLTLDNPSRRNAWSIEMEQQYFSMLDRAGADQAVRAIVVTGAERWFCPGLDSERLSDAAGATGLRLEGRRSQHYAWIVPKPMIAAINGACAGIGLVQALVCDVRFMARGAKFSTAYAKLGVPAEYGLSWLLPRMIGVERSLDLLLVRARRRGRWRPSGSASSAGSASPPRCSPTPRATPAMLAETCSPQSMAAIRRQVWGDLSRGYTEANEGWFAAMRPPQPPGEPRLRRGRRRLRREARSELRPAARRRRAPAAPPVRASQ